MIPSTTNKSSFTIIYNDEATKLDNYDDYFKKRTTADYFVVQKKWSTIPYLSLRDNLLLGLKHKKRLFQNLETYLAFLELSPDSLKKELAELTPFEMVKLQLLRGILLKAKKFLLLDVCENFTIRQTQTALKICQELQENFAVDVILITSDPRLADSFH